MSCNGFRVSRGERGGNPDVLEIEGEHGELDFWQAMQPSPRQLLQGSVQGPAWFFTGSPFGEHMVGEAWAEHGRRSNAAAAQSKPGE